MRSGAVFVESCTLLGGAHNGTIINITRERLIVPSTPLPPPHHTDTIHWPWTHLPGFNINAIEFRMQSFFSNNVDLISVRLTVTLFYYFIVLFYNKFDFLIIISIFSLILAAVKEGVKCCLIEVIFTKLYFNWCLIL